MAAVVQTLPSADETFGRRLRLERERRHVTIASIAQSSKISPWVFEALERDDASRWPSGIFRRAFIRAYAEGVGLDAEATTREFLERFPDPNDPDPEVAAASPASARRSARRLTLADTRAAFVGGCVLRSARRRLSAVFVDVASVATLGLATHTVLDAWWMAVSVAFAMYYAGGILALGNTPGVALCAREGAADLQTGTAARKTGHTDRPASITLFQAGRPDLPLSEPPTS